MNPASDCTILIVDDQVANLDVLADLLKRHGFEVLVARDGETALEIAQRARPDLILLDVMLPGMGGFEVCRRLKADKESRDIPVIFISALNEVFDKVTAFSVGGVDYITKPFQIEEVLARVQTHLSLREMRLRLEEQNRVLRESEEKYRSLTTSLPVGVYRTTLDGQILFANPALARMLGYDSIEELQATTAIDHYVNPVEREQQLGTWKTHRGVTQQEIALQRKDGECIWVRDIGQIIFDAHGAVTHIEGILEDITELKQAEVALRESLTTTETLYHASCTLIALKNLPDLLQMVVDELVIALSADRVALISVDMEAERIIQFVESGQGSGKVVHVAFDELRSGLTGWVLREGKPALSPKGIPDPRESLEVQRRRIETDCGDIIVVPLRYRDKMLGTLTAVNRPEDRDFTQQDVDLIVAIANQAAIAIENARLVHSLRESEEKFSKAFHANPESMIISSLVDGRYIDVNESFLIATGYARDEVIGRISDDLQIWAFPEDLSRYMQTVQEHGAVRNLEVALRRKSGEMGQALMASEVIEVNNERCLLTVAIDITKRKQAEAEREQLISDLEASQAENWQYEEKLKRLHAVSFALDSATSFDELCRLAIELGCSQLGFDRLGLWWLDDAREWLLGSYGTDESGQLRDERGQRWRLDASGLHDLHRIASGEIEVAIQENVELKNHRSTVVGRGWNAEAALWDGDQVVGHIITDNLLRGEPPSRYQLELLRLYGSTIGHLAKSKRAEVEREQLIADLEAYGHTVAHDLKNPLSAILGYAFWLVNDFEQIPPDEIRSSLEMITNSSQKMNTIINELLLLASVRKLEEIEITSLDMGHVVREALSRLSLMIEESQAEIVIPEPDTWPVALGYAGWVEEVWVNYISNAIKYGGTPPTVVVGASLQDDGMVRFWVRDNGSGLSTEEQERLFTQFTRLDEARAQGHGLGLSIVERIVEKLGGRVGVKSFPGQGCVFSFTLPRPECGVIVSRNSRTDSIS